MPGLEVRDYERLRRSTTSQFKIYRTTISLMQSTSFFSQLLFKSPELEYIINIYFKYCLIPVSELAKLKAITLVWLDPRQLIAF